MTPSSNDTNFLNQLLSSSSSSNAGNDCSGSKDSSNSSVVVNNKYASIIQMAFLLYLGEYVHARHLWRRQRNNNNSSSSSGDEYNQLSMFWSAAKYCYLWNTGGVSSSLNSTAGDNEESINLPYSTLMLRSLQTNAESSLEPLATYSKELVSIFRYRVNDRLHSSFDDIREDEFMLRMNLNGAEDDVLGRYGWKRAEADATHLVPNQEWKSPVDMGRGEDFMISTDDDRIHQLSEMVMFLEQTKMNA